MLITNSIYSQVELGFRNVEQAKSVQEVWNINVNTSQSTAMYFQLVISNFSQGKIYEAKSNSVQLLAGSHFLKKELITPITEIFVQPNFNGILIEGTYQIKLQAISYPKGIVLTEINSVVDILFKEQDTSKLQNKDKFAFNIFGSVNGQYVKSIKNDFTIAPSYARIDMHPTLTLAQIPLTADLFYTTEQQNAFGTINNYAFKFDYEQLKQNITQKLLSKTDELIANNIPEQIDFLKELQLADFEQFYRNMPEWKEKLSNPEFYKEVQLMSKLNKLESLMANPQIKVKYNKINTLIKEYNISSIDELESNLKDISKIPIVNITRLEKYIDIKNKEEWYQLIALMESLDKSNLDKNNIDSLTSYLSRHDFNKENHWLVAILKDSTALQDLSMLLQSGNMEQTLNYIANLSPEKAKQYIQFIDKNKDQIKTGKIFQDIDTYKQLSELESYLSKENKKKARNAKRWIGKYETIKKSKQLNVSNLLQDEEKLLTIGKKFNWINKKEEWLMGIKKLELGTTYPDFNDIGMKGTLVKGYNIVLNPKNFYLASAAGKSEKFTLDSITVSTGFNFNRFDKVVVANSIGWGNKSKTCIYVSHLYTQEKGNPIYDSIGIYKIVPLKNHIVIGNFITTLFGKTTRIEGNIAYSIAKENVNENNNLNIKKKDYAFNFKATTTLKALNLNLSAETKYLAPNYEVLNTPFVFKDRLIIDTKMEKAFVQKKVLFQMQYKYDKDSLHNNKNSTTIQFVSTALNLQFPKLPYFQINYTPYFIQTHKQELQKELKSYNATINLTTGYNYATKIKLTGSFQLSYTFSNFYNTFLYNNYNNVVNVESVIYNLQSNHTLSLTKTLNFSKINLQANLLYSHPKTKSDSILGNIFSTQGLMSYKIGKQVLNTIGFSYTDDFYIKNRWTIFSQLTYSFKNFFTIDTRLEYNKFKRSSIQNDIQKFNNINGLLFRTQIRFRL